ncbi:MAG: hypothetical protein K6A38_01460 [Lachnospiraceae bacterium]|nr:hypothetical protein [Lachnospiraceae bacterium]
MNNEVMNTIEKRNKVLSYKNFNVAIYMPVMDVIKCAEAKDGEYDKVFSLLCDNVKIGRVYIENYRSQIFATKEQLLKAKKYFEDKGIACSGGITTNDDDKRRGFASLCYSRESHRKIIKDSIKMLAEVFDEIIFDDFYFLNCRCSDCIKAKGTMSWSDFRLAQKAEVTKELILKVAHEANPACNVIIKYPLWYETFNDTGYDLKIDSGLFDSIYTGTETRNPQYQQQHMPKYMGYFNMRYYGSSKPGLNLGGWFDPYECNYNLTSYLEQGYLTMFAKAKEATLFCMGSLIHDPSFRLFAPAVGEMFEEIDEYIGKLGEPKGIAAYRPSFARGEDNVHHYLGMCGIPFEPSVEYNENAKTIFLAEGAASDSGIVTKMKKSLSNGADVVVTSGFVRKMGKSFEEFANVSYSTRKAYVDKYADTTDHGLSIHGQYTGNKKILIPQMDYGINDVWELAAAYDTDMNYPLVLRWCYDRGRVSVIVIPDNYGDLYNYPVQVLDVIRETLGLKDNIMISAPSKVMLITYDNDTLIIRSDLDYSEFVKVYVPDKFTKAVEIIREDNEGSYGKFDIVNGEFTINATPGYNYVLRLVK